MTNIITLYELVNKPDELISFSPFVITVKLFLLHKGLEFETVPLTYIEVEKKIKKLTKGKWSKVPLLKLPNGDLIYDSQKIGKYLDSIHQEYPLNINNPNWSILDVYNNLDNFNKPKYLSTMETRIDIPIEEFVKNRELKLNEYYKRTKNIGELLNTSLYLNGNEPGYYDYILIGKIQFLRVISPITFENFIVNNPSKSIFMWVERMLGLFGGYLKYERNIRDI
ncbi:hypothetical protein CONCODRAFT_18705, partial [Conidiobolus coronatus NRRL 28638]